MRLGKTAGAQAPCAEHLRVGAASWLYDGVDHPLEHDDYNGNRQYYEVDLAGNVRRLVGTGGVDLGGYRYTAFGETYTDDASYPAPTGVNALPVRWKGRWLAYSTGSGSSEIDLYDMRARWWCPQLGTFISVDGFAFHSMHTTLWGWGGQNPLRWRDTTGHLPDDPAAWEHWQAALQTSQAQDPAGTNVIMGFGAAAGLLSLSGPLAALAWDLLGGGGAAAGASCSAGAGAGAGPLVYGPSAGGALAALAAQLGGGTLNDLEKPMEQTWEQFSLQTLDAAAESGQSIVFDLSNVEDVSGVLNGTAYPDAVTSAELQYIAANWDRFSGIVSFVKNGQTVSPPW
jgi:RHS repeat-associated protein